MQSYDPSKQSVTFNSIKIEGFAKGTFIKVARNQDTWTYQPNNSGGGARSRNPDKSGTFEFTLQSAHPVNAALSAIARRDELAGEGVGEAFVKDRTSAASYCQAANAWIRKPPDWERQDEVGNQTWIIEAQEVDIFHDGTINT
jgi:hypothetical protein